MLRIDVYRVLHRILCWPQLKCQPLSHVMSFLKLTLLCQTRSPPPAQMTSTLKAALAAEFIPQVHGDSPEILAARVSMYPPIYLSIYPASSLLIVYLTNELSYLVLPYLTSLSYLTLPYLIMSHGIFLIWYLVMFYRILLPPLVSCFILSHLISSDPIVPYLMLWYRI